MMFQSFRRSLLVAIVAMVLPAGAVRADTIYLKNGRVIETATARQVDGKVEFVQFGQKMSIPADQVLRIEKGTGEEPPPLPPVEPVGPAPEGENGQTAEGDEGQADDDNEADSEEYWADLVTSIAQEKAQLVEQLAELRREERAFLFSHRSTAETRKKIEGVQARQKELDQELVDLRREARRLGIPPGWLRVKPAATTGR